MPVPVFSEPAAVAFVTVLSISVEPETESEFLGTADSFVRIVAVSVGVSATGSVVLVVWLSPTSVLTPPKMPDRVEAAFAPVSDAGSPV